MSRDLRNALWGLSNSIRGTHYSKSHIFVLVRLIFLKYCVDNTIGITSKEDMQCCLNIQKAISKRDPEEIFNCTIPVLQYLDKAFFDNIVLSSPDNIQEYAEAFGVDASAQRKSVGVDGFKNNIDALVSLDLDERDKDNILGKELVKELIGLFYETSFIYVWTSRITPGIL